MTIQQFITSAHSGIFKSKATPFNYKKLREHAELFYKDTLSQKLTQEQLAVLAGVSKPTLNSFEQGKTTIKLESALKILKVLGLA
ncbi:MAG: helix-turn-helix transcriptional regulator [Rhodospirillales bacterium]|nr:helix-turn-helix transcriptional regulator [Alphaproteobacteria bacterium]USO05459.1 MAG: helix-turn-helix transcriptional regulator [Rhodospirillales bacterium]